MRRPAGFIVGQQHVNARQQAGAKTRNYRPKFCRTNGCGLKFDHPGSCDVPMPSKVEIPVGQGNREHRRAVRRANGMPGRFASGVKRSPKAAPIYAARLGMARIRNHEGSGQ